MGPLKLQALKVPSGLELFGASSSVDASAEVHHLICVTDAGFSVSDFPCLLPTASIG